MIMPDKGSCVETDHCALKRVRGALVPAGSVQCLVLGVKPKPVWFASGLRTLNNTRQRNTVRATFVRRKLPARYGSQRAARHVTNNYMDRPTGSVTSTLGNLKWSSLEQQKRQTCLGKLHKLNNDIVDINPAIFFHFIGPRTRGAQRLHQEQAQHHVLFHSIFPRTVSEWNLLPTAISWFKQNFIHSS